ncbi:hypothetical protein MCP1_780003 [Candidatus Terasakiella magnetica]|nr:hypothetical protein MCP1_780003 [Candidatus Terasakiella magnetica]
MVAISTLAASRALVAAMPNRAPTITPWPDATPPVPAQWKVVQTVSEKFTCRSCDRISQPPAPFHPIARGRAGASLLAMILYAKYGNHQPLNRQSETFAREGIELDVSTLADWVGAAAATLSPLVELIRQHVLAAARLHGATRPPCRCWPREEPKPAGCGPMTWQRMSFSEPLVWSGVPGWSRTRSSSSLLARRRASRPRRTEQPCWRWPVITCLAFPEREPRASVAGISQVRQ